MPWNVVENHPACPASMPFGVVNKQTGDLERGGCHATREMANKQLAALYAKEPLMDGHRAQMTAASINDLPDSDFAYIEPGGKKDEQGKTVPRSKRHFPIHDAAHVRAALARAPQSPFGDKAMPKIRAAAKKFGVGQPAEEGRSEQPFAGPQVFIRSYPLEDVRILTRAQGSEYADGRTVEAYVAVFDREAEIQDHEGHYLENIARTAFDRAVDHARPQGGRTAWRTNVFYNHGMTLYGTPSDLFSVPLGTTKDIKVESRGLLTVTHYDEGEFADRILEGVRSGSITGHSFTGRIIKSDPQRPPLRGGYVRRADGSLQKVRRLELGLKEYGPTPFPAYEDTAVVGVRSLLAGLALPTYLSTTRSESAETGAEPDEAAPDDPVDSDTSADAEPVTDDPPTEEGHSSRAALLQRIAVAKTTRPGLGSRPEGEPS